MIESVSIAELAEKLDAELIGDDAVFSNLSIDTRTLKPGEAYLALRGERFDGHDFTVAAVDAGASALVVENKVESAVPQLIVADTHIALGSIASLNRQTSSATVVALTGSQGKTTVKEMIASILAERAPTLATNANLNNTIGVPLTLLRIEDGHEYAVIEMGANRAGEIAFSANATQPDIALLTGASAAHVEGFGSLEGIVEAKGEILDSLSADGVAVLNADDDYVQRWIDRSSHCSVVQFSGRNNSGADYKASNVETRQGAGVCFDLSTPQGDIAINLSLLGEHNATNATAAAAVAMEAGATLDQIQKGLAAVKPVAGRLVQIVGKSGSTLIDDTYNASPSSFKAAIDVLAQFEGRKVLIVGDMKELGDESVASHEIVGSHARQRGIDELWVTGEFADTVAQSYGESAKVFRSQQSLIEFGREQISGDTVYLVKGSRGAQMDKVVAALSQEGRQEKSQEGAA